MHSYSLDTEIRKSIVFVIAVISVFLVWLVSKIPTIHFFSISISVSISLGICFGLLWLLFDKKLWKYLVHVDLIVDLNGRWSGKGVSSYVDPNTGENAEYDIDVLIKQSFSKIEFSLSTKKSSSKSTMAAIYMNHTQPRVVYSYENKPFVDADPDMQRHTGLQEFIIDAYTMKGEYFSGKHRVRTGTIRLKKVGI